MIRNKRRDRATAEMASLLRTIAIGVILETQDDCCPWCGLLLDPCGAVEVDHHIPVSEGGPTELFNLRVLCRRCNQAKGRMMPDEFARLTGHDLV